MSTNNTPPFLTIGMATHSDWDGVYFTIQSLISSNVHRRDILSQIQLVVIDNNPKLKETADMIRGLLGSVNAVLHSVKYVALESPQGTSPSRNAIFDHADGEYVMVMDCHILLYAGAFIKTWDFLQSLQGDLQLDLFQGPMVLDHHTALCTHFNDEWRGRMWGTWGSVWRDNKDPDKLIRFSPNAAKQLQMQEAMTNNVLANFDLPYHGHERMMHQKGYIPWGWNPSDVPIEIPGQGLGLFIAKRDGWLGFNPHCRAFGGEELYIHEKYLLAGRKTLCLPWLKWVHRFGRVGGARYLNTDPLKVRNYILEFNELNLPIDPIFDHFVRGIDVNLPFNEGNPVVSEEVFREIERDPINWTPQNSSKTSCSGCNVPPTLTFEEYYAKLKATPRDLDQHMDRIKKYAEKCDSALELSYRKESSVALLAGKLKTFYSVNPEANYVRQKPEMIDALDHKIILDDPMVFRAGDLESDVDLVFMDLPHTAEIYRDALANFSKRAKRFIIIHDTGIFGAKGEDGGPGLMSAIVAFLRDNPEWSVIELTEEQFGMMVLGKLAEDKPKLPSLAKQISNFAGALTRHVAGAIEKVSDAEYEERLNKCAACPFRLDGRCSVCGCFIEVKASWKKEKCPDPVNAWGPSVGPAVKVDEKRDEPNERSEPESLPDNGGATQA